MSLRVRVRGWDKQGRLGLQQVFGARVGFDLESGLLSPKGPCTQIVYTLGSMYLHRDYFKANVYTIWVHGPSGKDSWVSCRVYVVFRASCILTIYWGFL